MKNFILIFLFFAVSSCNVNRDKKSAEKKFDTLFNARLWKMKNPRLRGRMVNDLIDKKCIVNISEDSLIKILGKPDEKSKYTFTYTVGTKDTSLLINYMLLYVRIDSTRLKVKDVWVSD